jgi:cell division protein FtsA
MDQRIIVGIDVGTTKICTLVASIERNSQLRILGVGVEAAQGIRKGVIVDLPAAKRAVYRSIDKAERTSGLEISSAIVSLAGSDVSSENSKGVVGVTGGVIDGGDITRAMDAARAIAIPHNREIVHVIQRGFNVDGQEGIRIPENMHAYRLEVETHIITASAASVENLRKSVEESGVVVSQFVLNPLAAAEEVLSETERQMGAVVCDIGGGTTDVAVYVDGDVWHTAVLAVGGNHISSDIAQGLRIPVSQAEELKIQHGNALESESSAAEHVNINSFHGQESLQVSKRELEHIISARVEEIFSLVVQEIRRSGYDGLLPAGLVLTGGSCELPGIKTMAERVMGITVRIGSPVNLTGMSEGLATPAFSTSVGLLRWALMMSEAVKIPERERFSPGRNGNSLDWAAIKTFLGRLLP